MINDQIADLLTRIRNAYSAGFISCEVLNSKMNMRILTVLKKYNYIVDFKVNKEGDGFAKIMVALVTKPLRKFNFKRVSKSGQRIYKGTAKLHKVCDGLGIAVLSTHKGVMSSVEAHKKNIGGEVLLEVW